MPSGIISWPGRTAARSLPRNQHLGVPFTKGRSPLAEAAALLSFWPAPQNTNDFQRVCASATQNLNELVDAAREVVVVFGSVGTDGGKNKLVCAGLLLRRNSTLSCAGGGVLGKMITAGGFTFTGLPAGCSTPCGEAARGKAGFGLFQILPLFTLSLSTAPAKSKSQTTQQK